MSPADKATTSPATKSRSGISCGAAGAAVAATPSARRITLAVLLTKARKPCAARCDRPSCTKRITVLNVTITAITTVALASALRNDNKASAVSSRLKGFR